jgi:acetyl-CoA carboxylase carboxyl transferase subunit alpha
MDQTLDFKKPAAKMNKMLEKIKNPAFKQQNNLKDQILELEQRIDNTKKTAYENMTQWEFVQVARHPNRPVLQDYINRIFSEFIELHGDRFYGDDQALIGGFATIAGRKVMLIGNNKGKNLEERMKRNFGMAHPEGYRKALRLMNLAQKFNIPIVSFIDTTAAFPGIESEERGQHEAIARNITEMARIEVPIIVIVTGEGGSGGALAIGVGDVICMLSHATYSVIPPEGCASILWRDASNASLAAEALKLSASTALKLGVIDEIITEPFEGAHTDPDVVTIRVQSAIIKYLKKLDRVPKNRLVARRFAKFSRMGKFAKEIEE